jgi:hypothetical protein
MDSDDIMLPNRMSVQLDFMNKNVKAVICGANIRMFKNNGDSRVVVSDTRHPNMISWLDLYKNKCSWYINNPTLCYRKSAIASVGNYRTDDPRILYIHEDYDLLARVLKKYQMAYNLPDVLLLYRLHSNQLTHNLDIQHHESLRNDILENASVTSS